MSKRMTLPQTGRSHGDILAQMRDMKGADVDWKNGRAPLYVFKATDDVYEVGRAGFFEYFSENALGARRAFPSVKRMEDDIVEMTLELFGAPEGAQGFMTTGGTESIILAMQTCRDWSRAKRGNPRHRGNVVAAETVHPAFNKGAKLMDLDVRRAPVGADLRMDLAALEALIDDDTIMIVGSAPNFSFGMIDPIRELGQIAERRGVWLHVDACVGGYLAPFVRMIGRELPDFDFAVPAVCSLSADLHKFGFCPKPASTVFYRDADKARHHMFDADVWPNGRFLTTTIVGTRPAGGVAGAWATLQYLGRDGYKRVAGALMDFVDTYQAGIRATAGLKILGQPDLSIVSFGSDEFDVFRVAELMSDKGWLGGLTQKPKGIHRMMSMFHEPVLNEYLDDLRGAIGVVRQAPPAQAAVRATY
jgi:glutamate/tyrosine decarboxylase-like PLP-dependent enzyme